MWELHIQHDGLRASRVLRGATQADAQWKATIQLVRWEARWTAERRRAARRGELLTRQRLAIHGHATATRLTAELEAQRQALDCLLAASLERGRFLSWNMLRDTSPFPCAAAVTGDRRTPSELLLQPIDRDDPSLLDKLFHSRLARKEKAAGERFARDLAAWQVASMPDRRCTSAESQMEERRRHRAAQHAQHVMVEQTKAAFYAQEKEAVEYFFAEVLRRSAYPAGFPEDATLQYVGATRTLIVDYELPSPAAWPQHLGIVYDAALNALREIPDSTTWRKASYDDALAQIALRVASELFAHDDPCCLERIAFNGHVRSIDRATGQMGRRCVLSLLASQSAFAAINLAEVDAGACFRYLKGVLGRGNAVRPLLAPLLEEGLLEDRPRLQGRPGSSQPSPS